MAKLKFRPGQVVATDGFLALGVDSTHYLLRHLSGDWGDLCESDSEADERALVNGGRLLSSYHTPRGDRFWIVTEEDRSVTTLLIPEEY